MTDFDYYYGNHTLLIKNSIKDVKASHFANEKLLFSELTQYKNPSPTQHCSNRVSSIVASLLRIDILGYFKKNRKTLMIPCGPDRLFSHCQFYYLFTINMRTKQCAPYHRQQCTLSFQVRFYRYECYLFHSSHFNHTDIVLILPLSHVRYNRFDRIPYLLKRWDGPMSVGVFVKKKEMSAFVNAILPYLGLPITFSVYVPMKVKGSSYHIRGNGRREWFPDSLYPMNLLRDLAIETIHTSHFLYLDADFFTSSN